MLFAMIVDKVFFGHNPEILSIIGSTIILSSTIYIAVLKTGNPTIPAADVNIDEERGLIENLDQSDEGEGEDEIAEELCIPGKKGGLD
jgi:hypothetical protein